MNDNTTIDDAAGTAGDPTPTRQCGRCRVHFPVEADAHPMELLDWWVCSNCAAALLPGRRRASPPPAA